MGTPLRAIELMLDFQQKGKLGERVLVAELGSQVVAPRIEANDVIELCRTYRPELVLSPDAAAAVVEGSFTKHLFDVIGFDCVSFDIADGPSTRKIDLNFDPVPHDMFGAADVVTNFGTTEHILNQLNCLKFIHDVTKPGGFMWHQLPMSDFFGHGFIKYDPTLFIHLAFANSYRIVDMRITQGFAWEGYEIPEFLYEYGLPANTELRAGHIEVLLQKTSSKPFVVPLDAPISPEAKCIHQLRTVNISGRIVLYGTGGAGRKLAASLAEEGFNVAGFVDSFTSGELNGLPVWQVDEYVKLRQDDDLLIIASSFRDEIQRALSTRGLSCTLAAEL